MYLIYESENHTSENEDDTSPPHSPPTIPQQSSTSSSLWSCLDEIVKRMILCNVGRQMVHNFPT